MKIKIRSVKAVSLLLIMFCILLTIDCFSIYYKLIGYQILQIVNILLCGIMILCNNNIDMGLRRKDAYFIVYYIAVCSILMLLGDYKYLGFISGCFVPVILFYIFIAINNRMELIFKIFCIFSNVICVICIISLVFYFAGSLIGMIQPSSTLNYSTIGWSDFNYNSYWGVYFDGHKTFFMGKTILRNIGIFVEGPVFTYVIITSLYIEMYFTARVKKSKLMLLFITALTTYSTTAIAISAILVFVYIYQNYMRKSILKLLVPIGTIIVCYIIVTVVTDKLMDGNDSGSVRLDDFIACIKCFADNPLIGVGFNDVRGIDPYRGAFRQTGLAGMSAGIPFVFACGGILHGSVYAVPIILSGIKSIRKKIDLRCLGFIALQFLLLTVIITEFTLLAQFFLVTCWYFALNDEKTRGMI